MPRAVRLSERGDPLEHRLVTARRSGRGGIALTGGPTGEWTTVYLIERSLSLDNVFLFSLLLAYFLVPPDLRGRVIVIGIAGALVLRAVAIAAARTAIHRRLPKSTPQAEAFAKQLKSQGYRFVGPTSFYAFMQNVGVVNDHIHGCFGATDYPATARSR